MIDLVLGKYIKDPTVKRHLLKTISWRVIGTMDTVMLSWLVTGQLHMGAKIGGLELFTKMTLYFLHERGWNKLNFGRPSKKDIANRTRIDNAQNLFKQSSLISRTQREQQNEHKAFTIWFTGLSGSGKSTLATELDRWLFNNGMRSFVIDGDNTRLGINSDLSFTDEDRSENIRRVAEMCKLFNDAGVIVLASFISPFEKDRQKAKQIIGEQSFVLTYVNTSIETCKARDIKGLYKLAEEGKIKNFTGVNSNYEIPDSPDIQINTDVITIQDALVQLQLHMKDRMQIVELIE
jgi:adenylyl-sulfate kinase